MNLNRKISPNGADILANYKKKIMEEAKILRDFKSRSF